MDYEELFPGRFLKAADLKGQAATVAIKSVVGEEIDGKDKCLVSFEGAKKQLVCNRTNAEAIKLMFGRNTDGWIGKRVTLFPVQIKDPFGDGDTIALRVVGSPEIDKPMSAEVKRGRKTLKISVRPTGKPAPKSNGKPAAKPAEMTDEEKAAAVEQERQQAAREGFPT
jgi:hypothetical protein